MMRSSIYEKDINNLLAALAGCSAFATQKSTVKLLRGTNKEGSCPHSCSTDQLGVVHCTQGCVSIGTGAQFQFASCKGQSISAPSFKYLVTQIWQAYMLPGRAYALVSQSMMQMPDPSTTS
eukprot:471073-Pelagomonas_calceolata.AAC.2